MNQSDVDPIDRLTLELARLPGIGERSAARLAFYIIKVSQEHGGATAEHSLARDLAEALVSAVETIGFCDECQNLSSSALCSICRDQRRDQRVLCVVESVPDLRAIEGSGAHRGRYHVLHGALAPLSGIGPDELKLDRLVRRVEGGDIEEVIVGTNPNVEGDATALYIARLLRPFEVRVTRLASGVPMGGELEFIDQATLGRALAQRVDLA